MPTLVPTFDRGLFSDWLKLTCKRVKRWDHWIFCSFNLALMDVESMEVEFTEKICHARMREIRDISISLNLRYVYMYEAIVFIRILMHFCSQKYKHECVILLPFLPLWERYMSYVNNNMYYVEVIVEHIKASTSIQKQCAGTNQWKMTKFDEGSKKLQLARKTPECSNWSSLSHYQCPLWRRD